jgi:hypothetical protein
MDKFVIGRTVIAIDYPSIQFSIRLAAATFVALLAKFRCSRREGSAVHINSHRIDDAGERVRLRETCPERSGGRVPVAEKAARGKRQPLSRLIAEAPGCLEL